MDIYGHFPKDLHFPTSPYFLMFHSVITSSTGWSIDYLWILVISYFSRPTLSIAILTKHSTYRSVGYWPSEANLFHLELALKVSAQPVTWLGRTVFTSFIHDFSMNGNLTMLFLCLISVFWSEFLPLLRVSLEERLLLFHFKWLFWQNSYKGHSVSCLPSLPSPLVYFWFFWFHKQSQTDGWVSILSP